MKRKFFSLMVTACAALFSFSGLTGCSGGGDDAPDAGVMTLEDFAKAKRKFVIPGGLVYELIASGEATSAVGDVVFTSGTLSIGDYPLYMTYTVTSYQPDQDELPEQERAPRTATLSLHFTKGSELAAKDAKVIRAIAGTEGEFIQGDARLLFTFDKPGVGGSFETEVVVMYRHNGEIKPVTFTPPSGTFVVK